MRTRLDLRPHAGYALVRYDRDGNGVVPAGFPILEPHSLKTARGLHHLFILCSALNLPEAAKLIIEMNREHRLQALFVRTGVPELLPQMLDRAGLRSIRNMLVHSDSSIPKRVLTAWLRNAQAELIAEAIVAEDRLIVVSCEPKAYEVSFDQMPALKKIAPRYRMNFELAEDGSFIHWPSADIHLDLDAIRAVIDSRWRKKSERLRQAHGREYGAAIAALRREHDLKQTDIAGISERQLRRVEESGAVSLRSIELLARAHRMTLSRYMDAIAHKLKTTASDAVAIAPG